MTTTAHWLSSIRSHAPSNPRSAPAPHVMPTAQGLAWTCRANGMCKAHLEIQSTSARESRGRRFGSDCHTLTTRKAPSWTFSRFKYPNQDQTGI
eukprot:1191063-Prorocentrum_minimum.AAC.3